MHGNMVENCQIQSEGDSIKCKNVQSYQRLFSIRLGVLSDDVVADITIGLNPKYGNRQDSDFLAFLSDGSVGVGFTILDVRNYPNDEPCLHSEGTMGSVLTNLKQRHYGPLINKNTPYPQNYNFLISTHQKLGACLTATALEGSYTTAGYFNATLAVGIPLSFDIYGSSDVGENYNIRYITADVHLGL